MQLSKKTRKEISQNRITYRNLIHWNAYTGLMASRKRFSFYTSATDQKKLMKINTESDFKAWAGFSNRTEGTVADVLNWKINPHFILWTILRVELLPPGFIHELAIYFCHNFHTRLAEEGIYIDFRYPSLLKIKADWSKGKLSLGNLKHHQRYCSHFLVEMHGSGNEKMIAAAAATHAVLNENPREAILNLFRIINSVYPLKKENDFRLQFLKEQIL